VLRLEADLVLRRMAVAVARIEQEISSCAASGSQL